VPDNRRRRTTQATGVPREPHSVGRRLEGSGCLVQATKQATDCGRALDGPWAGVVDLAVDVGQRFAPGRVVSRAHHTRRAREPGSVEVSQQAVDGWCPGTGVPDDDGPSSVNGCSTAAGELDFFSVACAGHRRCIISSSAMPRD
jgi:hypothetical protein